MKDDRWHITKIKEILDDLDGGKLFSTLELFSGYWKIRVAVSCKEKNNLVFRFGTFQLEAMNLGLMNAPSNFQRMMGQIFADLELMHTYLDDVVVFSRGITEHEEHLHLASFQPISLS